MNGPQEQTPAASRNNSSIVLTRRSILQGGSSLLLCNQGIARAQESIPISKYAGKILFANDTIAVGREKPSTFKNKFNSNEYIYATAYFSRPLGELLALKEYIFMVLEPLRSARTQDLSFGVWNGNIEDDYLDKPYFYIDISPRLDDPNISKTLARSYAYSYFGFAPGKLHKVNISVYGSHRDRQGVVVPDEKPAATGSFTFFRNEADDPRWRNQQNILSAT